MNEIMAYLMQSTVVFGDEGGTQAVSEMLPERAAEVAAQLLQDSKMWAAAAGVPTTRPWAWMRECPLYRALAIQGGQR